MVHVSPYRHSRKTSLGHRVEPFLGGERVLPPKSQSLFEEGSASEVLGRVFPENDRDSFSNKKILIGGSPFSDRLATTFSRTEAEQSVQRPCCEGA